MFLQKLDWVVFFLYVEWMKHHTARWGHVLKRQVLREYNRRARFTAMLACLAWPPACVAQARVSKQSHVASASQCAWVCSSQSQTIPVEPIRLGYFFSLVFVVSEIHGHEVTSNSSQAVSWYSAQWRRFHHVQFLNLSCEIPITYAQTACPGSNVCQWFVYHNRRVLGDQAFCWMFL